MIFCFRFSAMLFGSPGISILPYVCLYYFSSVSVAEWPPFQEIAAHSVDNMFSRILTIFYILRGTRNLSLVSIRFRLFDEKRKKIT